MKWSHSHIPRRRLPSGLFEEKSPRVLPYRSWAGKNPLIDVADYQKPDQQVLKDSLTDLQYQVTQEAATERPFENEFWNSEQAGIYVDITTGEPLFLSTDKFDSGCGWPSFTKPISKEVATYFQDKSHGMNRIEVRSRAGHAHLGHVFDDGPRDKGGSVTVSTQQPSHTERKWKKQDMALNKFMNAKSIGFLCIKIVCLKDDFDIIIYIEILFKM